MTTHRDDQRDDDQEQDDQDVLRGEDLLASLAMRHETRRADSPLYVDPDVVAWLDAEAVAPERDAERWNAEQVRVTAERIQAAASARTSKVRRISNAPPLRPAAVVGTVPQVLQDAVKQRAAPRLDLSAAAGVGRELWDEPCDSWVELPDTIPDGGYVAVRIKGESMVPLFHTGDTILVQLDVPLERGRIILVQMPDGGYAAKKVGRLTTTRIELISLNPDFAPVVIPRDERKVIGTVVLLWCAHHRRSRWFEG